MKHKKLVFVIQKHMTVRPHYDFRLEIKGVMPSWAIPKGPTLDNTKKRMAMLTSDHDLEYRKFEGVIPERQYGAGPVMIWDEGEYIPEKEISKGVREQIHDRGKGEEVMEEGLKKGEIKFFLEGKKIKGSFALVKTHGFGPPSASLRASKNFWLLIKHKDEYCREAYDANDYDVSAASGKSMQEIEKDFS